MSNHKDIKYKNVNILILFNKYDIYLLKNVSFKIKYLITIMHKYKLMNKKPLMRINTRYVKGLGWNGGNSCCNRFQYIYFLEKR